MNKQQQLADLKKQVAKLVRELSPAATKCLHASQTAAKAVDDSSTVIAKQILDHKDQLTTLLKLFNVTPGYAGKTFEVDGELFHRDQYIRKFWGCTPQHMLRVLGDYKPPTPTPEEKKPLFIKGKEAGIAEATSPTFVAEMKEQYNKRDEARILATREAFTETTHEHSFASSLLALLNAIENPKGILMPKEILDAAKKVRAKFSQASAASLQLQKNVEDSHKPTKDKFFANPKETGNEFPAVPKGAKAPKVPHLVDMRGFKGTSKKTAKKKVDPLESTPLATPTTNGDRKYVVAVYKASDGCRYGVFNHPGRKLVNEDGTPCFEPLQNYATAKEAEDNIAERLELHAKAATATSGEVL